MNRISASCQSSVRLLGVWTSKALFCRNCCLGCIDCMCSSQVVSFSLLPLFYFLFFYITIFRHLPNPSHSIWPSNFRPRAMKCSAQETWAVLELASSVREWQLSDHPREHTNGLLPRCLCAWSPEAHHGPPLRELR